MKSIKELFNNTAFAIFILVVYMVAVAYAADTAINARGGAGVVADGDSVPIYDASETAGATVTFTNIWTWITGKLTLGDVGNPGANKTFDTSTYTIAYDMDSGGAFRVGNVAGGNYLECLYGNCRMVGTYYLEGGYNLSAVDADGEYGGTVDVFTVDAAAAASSYGQAMHIDTDGELICADDDAAATLPCAGLLVTAGTGASKSLLTSGKICETDWNWTVGATIYVGGTPATTTGLTETVPTADFGQKVGVAVNADCIMVNIGGVVGF